MTVTITMGRARWRRRRTTAGDRQSRSTLICGCTWVSTQSLQGPATYLTQISLRQVVELVDGVVTLARCIRGADTRGASALSVASSARNTKVGRSTTRVKTTTMATAANGTIARKRCCSALRQVSGSQTVETMGNAAVSDGRHRTRLKIRCGVIVLKGWCEISPSALEPCR